MEINMVLGSKSLNNPQNSTLWNFHQFAQNFSNAIFEFVGICQENDPYRQICLHLD